MRRTYIWTVFGVCLAVALSAMAWISLTVLRLDRSEAQAQQQAAVEEDVRLALWRMDSALAPLIARESARPYFTYTAFYPAERAYTRMFAEIQRGEVLMPSPLLTESTPHVLLHFQFGPNGELTSPQVPSGNMRDLAEARGYVTHEAIQARAARLGQLQSLLTREKLLSALRQKQLPIATPRRISEATELQEPRESAKKQIARNEIEWQARYQSQQLAVQGNAPPWYSPLASDLGDEGIRPIWVGEVLVLARRVGVNGQEYVQGCWLDWPTVKEQLLAQVKDLLPAADLEPVSSQSLDRQARMLAALPASLVPGEVRVGSTPRLSPIRLSLFIAWACVLGAAVAVALLLLQALSLSERRGAFVSAVTHELRTPLTTFRMYTEMLAEGMLRDEEKHRQYLDTLRAEADRLGHLVGNVLAYARLDGRRFGDRLEVISLRELLNRVEGRLTERARQADMRLAVEARDAPGRPVRLRADPSAVEQILFNLVDNACKYAASASDGVIQLSAEQAGESVTLRVRDRGPGIAVEDSRRLFRPFSKSAREAANSAPGLGLGLALSRRLARTMGGDLQLDRSVKDGTCFVLTFPAA
ncbi:MAG: hypothetical protein AMJ84_05715 [Acidithiobacillales bacterium SM23_46]|nr:MAG: hypothetical protein AMJ84_05715 [Acidithiobacillales bacterium SM23_46]